VNSYGKLIVGVDERLGECRIEVAQDVQNLKQSILTGRGEVGFVRVTGRGSSVWLLGGLTHDRESHFESFLWWELFPEMPEKLNKVTALVMITTRRTPTPYLDSTAKKLHPSSGTFGIVRIEWVKNTTDREEWKRGVVLVVQHEVESGVNVTMGQHDLDNVDRCKSFVPAMPGDRDFCHQFRGYRRRDPACFFKEVLA
jgi:hypothetical protein